MKRKNSRYFDVLPYEVQRAFVPKWLTNNAMYCYFAVLAVCSLIWSQYVMPLRFMAVSVLSVLAFCIGANRYSVRWYGYSEKRFLSSVLFCAISLRICWSIYVYFFNIDYFGTPIGSTEDTGFYISIAKEFFAGVVDFDYSFFARWFGSYRIGVDDIGYPVFLGIQYLITFGFSDVFFPFVIKSILGGYTCVCIYRLAKRHFGYKTARLAAIFCMLNPNMIWWCASMMKETEMAFLTILFLELTDRVLHKGKISFKLLLPGLLAGGTLLFFRMALGVVAVLTLFVTLILSSSKVMGIGKKVLLGLILICILGIGLGRFIMPYFDLMKDKVFEGAQQESLEWRSQREGGNAFAKYAGATVFAPMIVTIPFPTFVAANQQQFSQMQMSGGNYIKNILSFFAIFSIFVLLRNGEWRNHVFPISLLLGYLLVLVVSGYAQSGRFHMPIWPLEMLFAAYGLSILSYKKRKWFNYVLVLEFFICVAWQWFKLKGRGMI